MLRTALPVLLVALIAGCGGGEEFDMAVIRGTVTCEGEPVPGGKLSFAPIAEGSTNFVGRGTVAIIQADGTYETQAVVGPLRVGFTAPDAEELADLEEEAGEGGEDAEEARQALETARLLMDLPCNAPSEPEVQVVAGDNSIDIQLIFRDPREFD